MVFTMYVFLSFLDVVLFDVPGVAKGSCNADDIESDLEAILFPSSLRVVEAFIKRLVTVFLDEGGIYARGLSSVITSCIGLL